MSKTIDKIAVLAVILLFTGQAWAWHDENHISIAKAAGYEKWFNAAGADITKIKAGDIENKNHYVNSPPGTVVTAEMVLDQVDRYNLPLIEIYPIEIRSEADLAREIARIANLSLTLEYQWEKEGRMLSRQEAYEQISRSASLFKGILNKLNQQ